MHDPKHLQRDMDGSAGQARRSRGDEDSAGRNGSDPDDGREARHRGDVALDEAGRERGDGRPRGVPGDARPGAEGRPSVVRGAQPVTPPADQVPTEGAVDRGETPSTENDPGQDL